jgi:hypothetical protein
MVFAPWDTSREIKIRKGDCSATESRQSSWPVPEKLAVPRCGFRVLIDWEDDCLDVVITPTFLHPMRFEEGTAVDRQCLQSRASSASAADDPCLWGLLFLKPVPLHTHVVDVWHHSGQQGVGRQRIYSGLLKLKDVLALTEDLDAHSFDFASDKVEICIRSAPRDVCLKRTK